MLTKSSRLECYELIFPYVTVQEIRFSIFFGKFFDGFDMLLISGSFVQMT